MVPYTLYKYPSDAVKCNKQEIFWYMIQLAYYMPHMDSYQ